MVTRPAIGTPFPPLTPREIDVAHHLSAGLDYEGIAYQLGVRPGTVAVHVANIACKLPNPTNAKPLPLVLRWATLYFQHAEPARADEPDANGDAA